MLLDTHALLWLTLDDARLGEQARDRILHAPRVLYSAVSISELVIKHMLGRIELPGGELFPEIFTRSGLVELPFTARHANAMRDDPTLARHDPFDRMLVAQARAESVELLTTDRILLGMKRPWIHDAGR